MKPMSVIIQSPMVSYDAERNILNAWCDVATLAGYLLPESGDIVQKQYGIAEKVTDRFIFKGRSACLKTGNRLLAAGKVFEIVWPGDYGKMFDVKLQFVNTLPTADLAANTKRVVI